jgi:hypothetical protein
MQLPNTELGDRYAAHIEARTIEQTSPIEKVSVQLKNWRDELLQARRQNCIAISMKIAFETRHALPLNKLRFLCFALCATNAKSIDNHRAHMGASSDANRVANPNATLSASFAASLAANHFTTSMLRWP